MTARVALVTDSTSNLPRELAAERHIYKAPLYVLWGEDSLKDGVDITEVELMRRLAALDPKDELPKTSQVSPQDFIDLFAVAREAENADEIVCGVISSALSGTYASAIQAKAAVDFPVHVVDTLQTSWALGFPMLDAADARDKGASAEEIVQVIESVSRRSKLLFTVDTLEYLHRGGRIGGASRLLGTALNIKPILELREGMIDSVDKVRTRKRAIEHLLKVAGLHVNGHAITRLAIIHGNVEADAQQMLVQAVEQFPTQEKYMSDITAVLGAHVGPGAIGIIVQWDES